MPFINVQINYLEYVVRHFGDNADYHSHNVWQAEFIMEGSVICNLQDQKLALTPLNILVIPPGVFHSFDYEGKTNKYYSVKFSCDETSYTLPLLFDNPEDVIPIRNYLVSILKNNTDQASIAIHMQNIIKILLEIDLLSNKEVQEKNYSEQIRDYLMTCPIPYPNAEDVAAYMKVCRPYLSKKIKAESNVSLKPFIDIQRMSSAKVLLQMSDLSISEIAFQLSFPDVFSFSKFFKRITQKSPSQYRKKYQTL